MRLYTPVARRGCALALGAQTYTLGQEKILERLRQVGGRLGAAGAGLTALWEGFAGRDSARTVPQLASDLAVAFAGC